MNKSIHFTTAALVTLTLSTGSGDAFVCPVFHRNYKEISFFSQSNDIIFQTVSAKTIQCIDQEIDELDESKYSEDVFDNFINTAAQLKELIVGENIKKLPDVVAFHKGYIGLCWETKDDKTVFLYSLPEGSLFFNIVGSNNFSERFTAPATKDGFIALLNRINGLV